MKGYQDRSRANRGVPIDQRFDEKVMPEPNSGCWLWDGCYDRDGYGFIRILGKNIKAHRFSLSRNSGIDGAGLLACHSCDTPECVNPAHLFWGDGSANQSDAARKGRSPGWRGLKSIYQRCTLTEADVLEIRRSEKRPSEMAVQYGVRKGTIYKILRRDLWKHVH